MYLTDAVGILIFVDLSMTPEEMRRTGYAVVDRMVAWMAEPGPVIRRATPQAMADLLPGDEPKAPLGLDAVLGTLVDDVYPHASRVAHPGYFAYIPGSTTWPAALVDFMSSVANVYAGSWAESAGPSRLELVVLDWFRAWLGLPEGAEGVLTSGGSAANLMAFAVAREQLLGAMHADAMIYCSDQAHSSVGRAARVLGFRSDQVHVIPSDDGFRLRVDALAAAVAADRVAGRVPLLVSASGGATNTGAVDPLDDIADLCAEHDLWLHVDAAYGGFATVTARGARALAGIGRADSVTLDPHKWFFQPMECGALLVRESGALERAFTVLPDYLADSATHGGEVNFSDRGLQLTRRARSVSLWASVATFGTDAFRAAIDSGLDLAALASTLVDDDPHLELLSAARLGIVCFRRTLPGLGEPELAAANAWLAAALEATGRAMVSSTRLHGRYALRLCVLNHRSREEDVRFVLDFLARTPVPPEVLAAAVPDAAVPAGPLLDLLDEAGRRELARCSTRLVAPAGATVVSRWAGDRDFYAIVSGAVRVLIDGVVVRRLGPGEFFGEIAATDWGSGYGYVRTADVVAEEPTQLIVVPAEDLLRLMDVAPALRERILAARASRLGTL
ncbi:aminotransferase class I/II-fold pyridoxal phosphate-dependent enzyme [Spongisporangium articulatum]|uniref:Aminotransferase class I/II-fold pyridoxal phosphate-dependent enzyme n=1 Tax=Spongisporangium articulatum TaxID=3362603 RepID=A0ABW8AGL9_9ACTN